MTARQGWVFQVPTQLLLTPVRVSLVLLGRCGRGHPVPQRLVPVPHFLTDPMGWDSFDSTPQVREVLLTDR